MSGRRIIVEGRVQGVWFRDFTRRTARELGVGGTVRNCSDGTVEVEAFAEDAVLDELERRLAKGPPAAKVSGLDSEPLSGSAKGPKFEIVY